MMVGPAELGLSLIAGGLTTLSPCVLPLLPLMLGGSVQSGRWAPLAIGAGMVTSFIVAGIALGLVGDSIGLDVDVVRYAGAWVLMAWALVMLVPAFERRVTGWLSPVAGSANQLAGRLDGGSLRGAFGLGALLVLVWSPCSGPLAGIGVDDGGKRRRRGARRIDPRRVWRGCGHSIDVGGSLVTHGLFKVPESVVALRRGLQARVRCRIGGDVDLDPDRGRHVVGSRSQRMVAGRVAAIDDALLNVLRWQ